MLVHYPAAFVITSVNLNKVRTSKCCYVYRQAVFLVIDFVIPLRVLSKEVTVPHPVTLIYQNNRPLCLPRHDYPTLSRRERLPVNKSPICKI
jgi:hypothetical protein